MIAVAGLVARALDNRVRRLLLYDAAGVPALAAELRGAAASGGGAVRQGNQRGDDQPGERHVLPPHSPRDSATLTRPCTSRGYHRVPGRRTTSDGSRGNARTCHRTLPLSPVRSQRLAARAIDRRHVDRGSPRNPITRSFSAGMSPRSCRYSCSKAAQDANVVGVAGESALASVNGVQS